MENNLDPPADQSSSQPLSVIKITEEETENVVTQAKKQKKHKVFEIKTKIILYKTLPYKLRGLF